MDVLKTSYASDSDEYGSDTCSTISETVKASQENYAVCEKEISASVDWSTKALLNDEKTDPRTGVLNNSSVNNVSGKESELDKTSLDISGEKANETVDQCDKQVDFFGLSAEDSDEQEDHTEDTSGLEKQKMVTVRGRQMKVEIPSTSFWAEMDPLELQSYQTTIVCNASTIKRKQTYNDGASNRVVFMENGISSTKYVKTCENQTSKSQPCEQVYGSKDSQQQNRKLFYIHSKVKPHLHKHTYGNNPPKLQEWTKSAHAGAINRIKWNIPEYSHIFGTCSMDSTIKLWNIWTQLDPCLSVLRVHEKAVRDMDWNNNGKQLLSCSYDKTAKVTDIEKGIAVNSLSHKSFVSCGKYHPGQPYLCVTGEKDKIQTWDLRTPQSACRTFEFKDAIGQVQDLVFSPDHSTLFTCTDLISRDSSDRNVIAWDFRTGAPVSNQIYQERYTLTRMKMHPSDRTLLAQTYGNYIAIFSLERPYKMFKNKRFEGHKLLGYSVGFDVSRDGANVYSGSSDGSIHCYNYQSGKPFRVIKTGLDVVMDLAIHPVLPSTIAICGWNGTVEVWR